MPGASPDPRRPDLLVVLRATATANTKDRPDWFDKGVCIRSIARSAEALRDAGGTVRLLCLLDRAGGAPSEELLQDLATWDEVVEVDGGSARRSWKAMLDLVRRRRDLDAGLVYFVEDDHLHALDALTALSERGALDEGFFLLYARHYVGRAERTGRFDWRPVRSGVSSFAVTRREFARSFHVLRTMSNANQSWDDLTWRVLLGPRYATTAFVRAAFAPDFGFPPWSPRTLYNLLWRVVAFLWARVRRPGRAWAVVPNLATHVEIDQLAPDRDWRSVSDGVDRA